MRTLLAVLLAAAVRAAPSDVEAVQALVTAVASGEEAAASRATAALHKQGLAVIPLVLEIGGELGGIEQERVRALLSSFGTESYSTLRDAGAEDVGDGARKWSLAIRSVAGMGASVAPIAVRFLRARPGSLEEAFAYKVLGAQGKMAVETLLPLARDPNVEVRLSVVDLLGQARDPRAADALVAAASEPDARLSTPAIWGLTRLRDPRVIPMAIQAIHHRAVSVRGAAAVALFELQQPDESRVGLAFLARSDPAPSVRDTAAGLLRDTKVPVSVALGRRYAPLSISPAAASFIEGRQIRFLLFSMAVVWLVVRAMDNRTRRLPVSSSALATNWQFALLLLGVGWFWGRWMTGIDWRTEYQFLVAASLAVIAARLRTPVPASSERGLGAIWTAQVAIILTGYFLGWMQLWG